MDSSDSDVTYSAWFCVITSFRDQKMHKLVFDEGGLPDGTEVAYYSRGKVPSLLFFTLFLSS